MPNTITIPSRLQVGDIVHYVLDDQSTAQGEIRPAVVVRLQSESAANLILFADGANDYPAHARRGTLSEAQWKQDVEHSAGYEPGTWHRTDEVKVEKKPTKEPAKKKA